MKTRKLLPLLLLATFAGCFGDDDPAMAPPAPGPGAIEGTWVSTPGDPPIPGLGVVTGLMTRTGADGFTFVLASQGSADLTMTGTLDATGRVLSPTVMVDNQVIKIFGYLSEDGSRLFFEIFGSDGDVGHSWTFIRPAPVATGFTGRWVAPEGAADAVEAVLEVRARVLGITVTYAGEPQRCRCGAWYYPEGSGTCWRCERPGVPA